MLAGVGAQYDSEVVYHNLRQELKDLGVIFEDMDEAVIKYPELVKKYFQLEAESNLYEIPKTIAAINKKVFRKES